MPDDAIERWNECCRWSGWLAERGVTSVSLAHHGEDDSGSPRQARTTDLPGMMMAAPVGTVMRWSGGALRLTETGWRELAADGVQPGG